MGRITGAVGQALDGRLPPRYHESWLEPLFERALVGLPSNPRILDIGSGRRPVIPFHRRPDPCHYVGLDLSRTELEFAPPGSYDELVVSSAVEFNPDLEGEFDLVVSTQVFEHLKPLDRSVENMRLYLRKNGLLVSQFSGKFAVFALANRLMPDRASEWFLRQLDDRHMEVQPAFAAHYHKCWYSALRRMFANWSSTEIIPRYLAAKYFGFSRTIQALYIAYEEWSTKHPNLASYYLVAARR